MKKKFSEMSVDELLDSCRTLYERDGIKALSYSELSKQGALYYNLYRYGVNQKELIVRLGLQEQYQAYKATIPLMRNGRLAQRWTWAHIVKEAKLVKEKEGILPPAAWFQSNGYGTLVTSIYYLKHTWEDLRQELGDFENSSFVESRNGLRWRSHPEAACSNFLYARGIEHKRGERYPEDYANHSVSKYAYFDLHFVNKDGVLVDVEIWGDKPNGHDEAHYKVKREDKEAFNRNNPNFLGIHYKDCYEEATLSKALEPYIGVISPFKFDKPTDRHIHTTHWSNADELLEYCQQLASSMPNGDFPTEEWLRKRGKWASRPGETYNTLSIYIKTWLGGVRNLRRLLGQAHVSTQEWDKDSAIAAYKNFYRLHGMTPGQVRHCSRRGENITQELANEAARLDNAVSKYAGGAAAINKQLGIEIDRTREWTKEAILDGFREIISEFGISPMQLAYDYKVGKIELPTERYQRVAQLIDAVGRQFSGVKEIYETLGFTPPSRPRQRRNSKLDTKRIGK